MKTSDAPFREMESSHAEKIRQILARHGRLAVPVDQLAENADLYKAGLTSLATVGLMLALEDQFEVEFADNMLSRQTFSSITSIARTIDMLVGKTRK